ncbi:glutathionylspermidine synthase family protein [Bacillus sp. 03113]|uniref:glutathionylspermidine synthase family protein n=1 Tax=Bacillus sp. 03113 TaxID=2578211 RepID=UPI0011450063|nr:glutathionylspermidine synthase family protein [Bacillus sp. 03113]
MTVSYHEKRKQFYNSVENFWADLYGEEYALFDIALIEKAEFEKIQLASERIGQIFFKMCSLLREVPDQTLLDMGFPEETLPFIRLKTIAYETIISRLDLIPFNHTYKCIEMNADTPTFIKELFHINGKVCRKFGEYNPNEGMDTRLGQAVKQGILESALWKKKKNPYIVFTAHEENEEDRETVLYLQELCGLPSRFVPLHMLRIEKEIGLFDENGVKIDILYRQTFPIENLIADEDEKGNKIGLWLLELVAAGKLAIINPPSAFLLQNKAVQAAIWGLHAENHPFFTNEEHSWIEEYFLPTYLESDYFIKAGLPFVKKPSFGREGDTVEIYNQNGLLLHEDIQKSYTRYLPVYQQYVNLPTRTFMSEKGKQEGHVLVGSFLLNGKPSAAGFRVGERITNNLSYYLPVGVK